MPHHVPAREGHAAPDADLRRQEQGFPLVPEAGGGADSVMAALRDPRRLRTEVMAGLVVALALIPEALSFSIIAGVDPRLGLFASFTMACTIAIVGGRPAMISAATGAIALVVAPISRGHGVDYLIATVCSEACCRWPWGCSASPS